MDLATLWLFLCYGPTLEASLHTDTGDTGISRCAFLYSLTGGVSAPGKFAVDLLTSYPFFLDIKVLRRREDGRLSSGHIEAVVPVRAESMAVFTVPSTGRGGHQMFSST